MSANDEVRAGAAGRKGRSEVSCRGDQVTYENQFIIIFDRNYLGSTASRLTLNFNF
jgi:hypothetical protein